MKPITDCSLTQELGGCCCTCRYQLTLRAHPSNKGFGKGSVLHRIGWVCTNPELWSEVEHSGVFFDEEHGFCELYTPIKIFESPPKPVDLPHSNV